MLKLKKLWIENKKQSSVSNNEKASRMPIINLPLSKKEEKIWFGFNLISVPYQSQWMTIIIFFLNICFLSKNEKNAYNREESVYNSNLLIPGNCLSKAVQRKQEASFCEEIILAFYTSEELFSFTLKNLFKYHRIHTKVENWNTIEDQIIVP